MKYIFLPLLLCLCVHFSVNATIWHVGPGRTYTMPSQIKDLVQDGDFIYLEAGVYLNDAVKWNKRDLKFQGTGSSILRFTSDIPNGKGIWVFETPGICDNVYIGGITFDGAQVSDDDGGNGAGIRFQANNLFVGGCTFINCQNGILEGHNSVTTSNVTIQGCEFYNNGYQESDDPEFSGYAHNIYISASVDSLFVSGCWFHHPRGQANSLKTRAQRSYIAYNLIDEEAGGYGSWELNIAQGGLNIILGNVIIQGPSGANHGIISYDAATNALEDFYFVNNTVINQYGGNNKYFNVSPSAGIQTYFIYNNIFASVPGANNTFLSGNTPFVLDTSHNLFSTDYLTLGFTDPSVDDYSLTASSIFAINHGIDAGSANTGFNLYPVAMPRTITNPDGSGRLNLDGMIDIGAYEYYVATGLETDQTVSEISVYPNPSHGQFRFLIHNRNSTDQNTLLIYNLSGELVYVSTPIFSETLCEADLTGFPVGIYFARIKNRQTMRMVKMVLN